jgi:hypothetical protein
MFYKYFVIGNEIFEQKKHIFNFRLNQNKSDENKTEAGIYCDLSRHQTQIFEWDSRDICNALQNVRGIFFVSLFLSHFLSCPT